MDHGVEARRRTRAIIAVVAGVVWGTYCFVSLTISGEGGADFTWPWRAARALLDGENPYAVIRPTGVFPYNAFFKYPLPAALFAVPFVWLPMRVAAGIFVGVSCGAFAWFLTRDGCSRWPILLGGSMFSAARSAQWSPLMCAALLASPWAVGLGAMKPNLGVAMFAARPSWRGVTVGAAVVAASLAVFPGWPLEWLRVLRSGLEHDYRSPVLGGPGALALGPLLLVVLVHWRDPDARLVAALGCVPQVFTWYDQLPLALVARSRREALAFALPSVVAAAWSFAAPRPYLVVAQLAFLTTYVPAIVVVLVRGSRRGEPTVTAAP